MREPSRAEAKLRAELNVIRRVERALAMLPTQEQRESVLVRIWEDVRRPANGELEPDEIDAV